MKKLAFLALLSALSVVPAITIADPVPVTVDILCPNTAGISNVLTNFGEYIAGYGTESIQGQNVTPIYFKSTATSSDIPVKLDSYTNEMADYNSVTGQVICSYISSQPNEPRFSVFYTLTNGKGGVIASQSSHELSVKILFGFKA